MTRTDSPRTRLAQLLGWALVLLAAGCGGGPEYGAVEGVVTDRGKALAEVEVRFIPDPEAGGGPTASAFTDKDGRYRLYTRGAQREGAAVGRHRVCVLDPAAMLGGDTPGGEDSRPARPGNPAKKPPPRVPLTLTAPDTTPFRDVEVRPGPQNYDIEVGTPAIKER